MLENVHFIIYRNTLITQLLFVYLEESVLVRGSFNARAHDQSAHGQVIQLG